MRDWQSSILADIRSGRIIDMVSKGIGHRRIAMILDIRLFSL